MPASSCCHTPRCRPMFSSFQESFVPLSSIQAVHDRTMTTRFLCMICFALLRAALDGRLDFAAAPPSCGEASCGWPYLAAKLPRPRVSAHRESAWPGFSMAASGFSKRDTYAHSYPRVVPGLRVQRPFSSWQRAKVTVLGSLLRSIWGEACGIETALVACPSCSKVACLPCNVAPA